MKSVKEEIIDRISGDLKKGSYAGFNKFHVRAAVNALEGKIFEAMEKGEAIGITGMMSIYPDPGSMAVWRAKKKMGIAKAIRKKNERQQT